MQNPSVEGNTTEEKIVDFGSIPVDTVAEKSVWVHNQSVVSNFNDSRGLN